MATTLRDVRPAALPEPPRAAGQVPARRPFRDNPRLILLGIVILLVALVAMVTLADRAPDFNPNFLTEVVLYALSAADLTMLLALGFVLARNIVKLVVERRRGLPFSRFRAKLVGALLGLTIIPAVLVLLVGGELIRSSTRKWVSQPVDDVLTSARQIAERVLPRARGRGGPARRGGRARLAAGAGQGRRVGGGAAADRRRHDRGAGAPGRGVSRQRQRGAGPRRGRAIRARAAANRHSASEGFVSRVMRGSGNTAHESLAGGGELVQAGSLIVDPGSNQPVGVVIASEELTGALATESRKITGAYENYKHLRVLTRPLQGMYLSFFLMMTLMILVSATWMGLYLAKRITRPVQMLARARARLAPAISITASSPRPATSSARWSRPSTRWPASWRPASESSSARGSISSARTSSSRNGAATSRPSSSASPPAWSRSTPTAASRRSTARRCGCSRSIAAWSARRRLTVFDRADLQPLGGLLRQAHAGAGHAAQEVALVREGRELHLAAAATPLQREDGSVEGAVLVFDDVTPLIRTQRVAAWRDVARRLAHEIKNPLTPIQLCAERMRRHFTDAPRRRRGRWSTSAPRRSSARSSR